MELVRNFTHLNKENVDLAGGKGASLGEMTQADIPVPPGFVVLSDSFERFIEETNLKADIDAILHTVNHQEIHTVEHASEKIRGLILEAQMPQDIADEIMNHLENLDTQYMAVRSSATSEDSADAAWAGQLDSFLNTTKDDVLSKVKHCWSSLFTPRAIFYRFEKGLHGHHISVAVVVQQMVESEISGIAFSVHPVTEDPNQLIIEAGYGLGEAIVSGQITPDSYVVEKNNWEIVDTYISEQDRGLFRVDAGGNEWKTISKEEGEKQKLTNEQIHELAKLIVHIEKHYGFPCDIEWAYQSGKFYIVQSRPITTLSNSNLTSGPSLESPADSSDGPSLQKEPQKNPLLEKEGLYLKDAWVEQGRWLQPTLVYTFFSHWHTSKVAHDIVPELTFRTIFSVDGYAFQYKKDRENIYTYLKDRYAKGDISALADAIDEHGNRIFSQLKNELTKDDAYIENNISTIIQLYKEFTGFWSIEVYTGDLITKLAKEVGYVASEADLFAKVHPHLRDTWIEKESHDIISIAQKFIAIYGDAKFSADLIENNNELKTATHHYLNNYAWSKISKWIGDPITTEHVYARLEEEINNCRAGNHIETKRLNGGEDQLDGLIKLSISTAYWRAEGGKMEMMMALRMREILNRIAAKNNITYEQVLYLTPNELIQTLQSTDTVIANKEVVIERSNGFFSFVTQDDEEIIISSKEPEYATLKDMFVSKIDENTNISELHGIGASPGYVKGIVRVIESAKQFGSFQKDEILVAPETTPSFVPLMRMAAAILTGKGGITSHAAIVSRELGKPCIIAIKDVTKILKDGDMIEVDAHKGEVRVISSVEKSQETWNHPALANFDPSEYEFHGLWTCAILPDYFWTAIYCPDLVKKLDLPITEMGCFTMNYGNFLAKPAIEKQLHDRIMQALEEKDLGFFKNLKTTIDEEFSLTKATIDSESAKPLSGTTIRNMMTSMRRLAFLECVGYLLTHSFEPELLAWAKKHSISDQDINDYIPAIETPLLQRQKELTELKKQLNEHNILELSDSNALQKISEHPELARKFYEHVERFGWIEILGFAGKKLTAERLLEILRNFEVGEHVHKDLQNTDEGSKVFLEASSYLAYIRQIGAEYFSMCSLAMMPVLENCAKVLSVTYNDIMNLLPAEIAQFVDSRDIIKLQELLNKRAANKWALFEKGEHLNVIEDKEDIARLEKLLLPKSVDTGELRGQAGFAGIAQGPVKIILSSAEFGKLEKGDVLVTTMTTPDFVTLMQMASAIVTDIGGLLSHAAIVSRELKKPCVIGTKFATQLLKDGDLVEVDANTGIVKVLKD